MKWCSWMLGVFGWLCLQLLSGILTVLKRVLLKVPKNGTTLKYCLVSSSIVFSKSIFRSSSTSAPEIMGTRRRRRACVSFISVCRLWWSLLSGVFSTHISPTCFGSIKIMKSNSWEGVLVFLSSCCEIKGIKFNVSYYLHNLKVISLLKASFCLNFHLSVSNKVDNKFSWLGNN